MSWLIRAQADGFFKAYKVLAKSGAELNSPAVVNLAFALELYIKDLHFALKDKAPYGHNILKLFEKLPEPVRQEISDHNSISQNSFNTRGNMFSPQYFSSTYRPYERFVDQIKEISEGFEDWRYSHERSYPDSKKGASLQYNGGFAEDLIEAIKSAADSARGRSVA